MCSSKKEWPCSYLLILLLRIPLQRLKIDLSPAAKPRRGIMSRQAAWGRIHAFVQEEEPRRPFKEALHSNAFKGQKQGKQEGRL